MPLDPSIPLRAISGRRNNLVEEYAQAVNIKNALAQQKAAEAELARQENVRNALSKAVNPQTGEVDWQSAVNTVATVDPMTALSLRGELAKEQASGFDMKAKQIEYYSKAFDQAAQIAPTITDQAGWDSLRQWAYGIDPNLAERIPREFTPQNAQALAMTALDLKDRISLRQGDRTFAAQEAERRRDYEMRAAEHYDKTGERLPPYEAASGGMLPTSPSNMPAGTTGTLPDSPDRMPGVIYDFNTLEGDPNDPNTPAGYRAFLEQAAPILSQQLNVPEDEVLAMAAIESGMNPQAKSPTGVKGPMQLTQATGEGMGLDRNDPMQNTYGGAQYYAELRDQFQDPALAAAAYNSGPEAVQKAVQWAKDTGAPWEQSGYVRPEGVQHSRKFVEQIRVIRQMRDAQIEEVRASDAPPAAKREAEKEIKSAAQKAEMDLAAETQAQNPTRLVTLKMKDGTFKSFNAMDEAGINKAIAEGAVEATPSAATKPPPGKTTAAYEYALNGLDAMERDAQALIDHAGLWWGSGFGGETLSEVPGSPAADFAAALEPLKAHTAFGGLQEMRNASPTGGALGQVAVKELELLQNNIASLSQKQSPEQMRASLQKIVEHARNAKRRLMGAFDKDFPGDAMPMNSDSTPTNAMPQAGDVQDGYRFKGGDPSDAKNWERVQ